MELSLFFLLKLMLKRIRPDKSEVMRLICEDTQTREMLGWQPQFLMRQGLEDTVNWMHNNLHNFKSNIYNV